MRLPIEWLKDYVDINNISDKKFVEEMIMTGSNSEGIHAIAGKVENIVVGKIVSISQHPEAERLKICQTDIGSEVIQIVTAATNMKESDFVPVALHGAVLADGTKIKKGKLRGEVSNGMFCSLEELGVEKNLIPKFYEDGLLILEVDTPLGMDVADLLNFKVPVVEFEITPNRPDCLSIMGLARETAATFEKSVNPLVCKEGAAKGESTEVTVNIQDPELCPRYMAKVVRNVKVKASPLWLQARLIQAGMRPINNIVDITNYVMLELGQPIHAFDFDKLTSKEIGIRRAKPGETILTLDEKERTLTEEMLLITSGDEAVAIAGLMGGANSEVDENTTSLLLEVANFNKSSVRKTSKDLGLRSEASSRFEKGVSPETVSVAMERLCYLLETVAGATCENGVVDVYPLKAEQKRIALDADFINKKIGITLSEDEIKAYLKRLGIEVVGGEAVIPFERLDLERPIDLVEEIARLYGYNKIPLSLPKMDTWGAFTNGQRIEMLSKHELFCRGVDEILTYSFVSEKELDKINVSETSLLRNQVKLINPLGEEFSTMRTTLLPSLLEVLSRNYNRKIKAARLFEIGNTFIPKEVPIVQEPIEKKALVIGTYGEKEDFYALKGIVDALLSGLNIEGYHYEKEAHHPSFHPGRCANVIWNGHVLGTLGELHPIVLDNFNIGARAYAADLDFNMILQLTKETPRFKAIPKYPAIERDMAVVVKEEVESFAIEALVKEACGDLFESITWFDLYRGPQIGEGYKSLAYALTFRAPDRTLTDDEINPLFEKTLQVLSEKVGAQLR